MDLVSVIIPTYNRPINILLRAVNSVLGQTYPNIELIVVNDAPENQKLSKEISDTLQQLNGNIQYIVHDHNRKLSATRNTGIAHANGAFIAFLDDDDWWDSHKIQCQMGAMVDGIDVVYTDCYLVSNGTKKLFTQHKPVDDLKRAVLIKNCIPGSASGVMVRSRCLREIGGFDTNLMSHEDIDMWIRLLNQYQSAYVRKPLVYINISSDSTFRKEAKANIETQYHYANQIFEKHRSLYEKNPDDVLLYWNDLALSALLNLKSAKLFWLCKQKAFSFAVLHRYNFFLFPIKVFKRFFRH